MQERRHVNNYYIVIIVIIINILIAQLYEKMATANYVDISRYLSDLA